MELSAEVKCSGCLRTIINKRNILWVRANVEQAAPFCSALCSAHMLNETAEHPFNNTLIKQRFKETGINLRKVSEHYGVDVIKYREE